MRDYLPLTVTEIREETSDSRRILLDARPEDRAAFAFRPGQHLPLRADTAAGELRRTYSLCSSPGVWPLELGIRIQPGGQFGAFVAGQLKPGDSIEAMPPSGRFQLPDELDGSDIAGIAAGSGVTPIRSMIEPWLARNPENRFTLIYGNRRRDTTMFIDDLFALKNRFMDRLRLHFLFSREAQEFDVAAGRLEREALDSLLPLLYPERLPDAAFVCGPDTMIDDAIAGLSAAGVPEAAIHMERFGAPRRRAPAAEHETRTEGTEVTVIMDGQATTFTMPPDASNLVDAAADANLSLPFSCKGGVCATCRTHVREGGADMAQNYGLEPWEVEAGFILACQSQPTTDKLVLDYDKA